MLMEVVIEVATILCGWLLSQTKGHNTIQGMLCHVIVSCFQLVKFSLDVIQVRLKILIYFFEIRLIRMRSMRSSKIG